jgi:hypothetical protein
MRDHPFEFFSWSPNTTKSTQPSAARRSSESPRTGTELAAAHAEIARAVVGEFS